MTKAQYFQVHIWCRRRDSNPHGSPRHPLKMVCLPFPPHRHERNRPIYFAFAGAGTIGAPGACEAGKLPWLIGTGPVLTEDVPADLLYMMASKRLVTMKTTTTMVVSLVMKPDVPELPKRV